MIVDSHCHLRDDRYVGPEWEVEDAIAFMDAVGIAKAVVFQAWKSTRMSIETTEAAVAEYPDRLIPYVYAVPHFERPVLPEIENAIVRRGFRGIKMHKGDCRFAEYLTDPVMELAQELDVPCLVDFKGEADPARRIAEKLPRLKLIIAHLGQCIGTDASVLDKFIAIAEEHPAVLLDASAVVLTEKIAEAAQRIGSERVLWGTDAPAPGDPDAVKRNLAEINAMDLSATEKEDILGRNILRLLERNGL